MMGDVITCPSCQGWDASETGMTCVMCGGDGVVWDDDAIGGEVMPHDEEDNDLPHPGCLFGDKCLMADPYHFTSECYTAEMVEEQSSPNRPTENE